MRGARVPEEQSLSGRIPREFNWTNCLHPLRSILNKILWDKRQNPEDYVLSFIHRGAPGDIKTLSLKKVGEVGGSWFTYQDDSERETTIPFHRITLLRNVQTGDVLWRKRGVSS